jgi:hypothetical protein
MPSLPELLKMFLWLAALGGIILLASRFAGKAAGKASAAL